MSLLATADMVIETIPANELTDRDHEFVLPLIARAARFAEISEMVDFAAKQIGQCLWYTLVRVNARDGYVLQCGGIDGYSGWGYDAIQLDFGWETIEEFAECIERDVEELKIEYESKYESLPSFDDLVHEYYLCLEDHELRDIIRYSIEWGIDQLEQNSWQ
jgi:hypothetical protein